MRKKTGENQAKPQKHLSYCSCCKVKRSESSEMAFFEIPHVKKKKSSDANSSLLCNQCRINCNRYISLISKSKESKGKRLITALKINGIIEAIGDGVILMQNLNKIVIGQDRAKAHIIAAIISHYLYIKHKSDGSIGFKKPGNVLMLGPSGSGKTLIMETLSELINVNFVKCDATVYTEVGYVGQDVSSIVTNLYRDTGQNIVNTEISIVFIDEIDKLCRKVDEKRSKDVNGRGVQHGLLKLIEGTRVPLQSNSSGKITEVTMVKNITQSENKESKNYIDTSKILFICAGAFGDIENIISERIGTYRVGYDLHNKIEKSEYKSDHEEELDLEELKKLKNIPEKIIKERSRYVKNNIKRNNLLSNLEPEDLEKYGMIREFRSRIQKIVILESLSARFLKHILKQELDKFGIAINAKITVSHEYVYEELVNQVIRKSSGARGIQGVIWDNLEKKLAEQDLAIGKKQKKNIKISINNANKIDISVKLLGKPKPTIKNNVKII